MLLQWKEVCCMSVKKFNKQLTEYRRLQRNKNRYNKSDKLNKGTQKTMFDYLMKSSLFKPSKSFMKRIRNDKAVKRFAERSFYENYKNRMMEQPGTYQNLLNMGYKSETTILPLFPPLCVTLLHELTLTQTW